MYQDNRSLSQVYEDYLNPPEQDQRGRPGVPEINRMFKTDISSTVESLESRGFSQ